MAKVVSMYLDEKEKHNEAFLKLNYESTNCMLL